MLCQAQRDIDKSYAKFLGRKKFLGLKNFGSDYSQVQYLWIKTTPQVQYLWIKTTPQVHLSTKWPFLAQKSMENLVGLLASNNNLGMDPFGHPSVYGALILCRVGQNTQIKKGSSKSC